MTGVDLYADKAKLVHQLRRAGFGDYADAIDTAVASGATVSEVLFLLRLELRELLKERALPRVPLSLARKMSKDITRLID